MEGLSLNLSVPVQVGKARDIMEPFILCRKKENVLTDLPPKKNCVELSVLLPDQRSAYDDLVQQFKEKVILPFCNRR